MEVTAHYVQAWQPKAWEARVTAVGPERLFAVAIHAGSEETLTDWRRNYGELTYRVIDVPEPVRDGISRYLTIAGLAYSAFDFVITKDNHRWVVLEANGNGMWGWLSEECGLPIGAAIAAELTGLASG